MIHRQKLRFFALAVLFLNCSVDIKAIQPFPSTDTSSTRSEYTVNLMWINRSLIKDQNYIFPAQEETDLKEKYLNPIVQWAKLNSESTVQVWFDGALTTKTAYLNTLEKIKEYTENVSAPIVLKDVQEIPEVHNNKSVFLDIMPVYFRADLLRVIAALHTLSSHNTDYFVYADFDVKPLSQQELFDNKTVQHLNTFGIVMAKAGAFLGYENSFQIISGHNKNLSNALQKTIVDLNIQRAHNALRDGFFVNTNGRKEDPPMRPLQQIVYDSYRSMFKYLYHVQGLATLKVRDFEECNGKCHETQKVYDDTQHGLQPFGLTQLDYSSLSLSIPDTSTLKKS